MICPASLLLLTKPNHVRAMSLARNIAQWLAVRGVKGEIFAHQISSTGSMQPSWLSVAGDVDAVVVLGGDGTLIGVARYLIGRNIPLLGINLGRVGFLTTISADDWHGSLAQLLAGRLLGVSRTVLSWSVQRAGHQVHAGYAVNDVVIGRGPLARLVNLHLEVVTAEDCPACAGNMCRNPHATAEVCSGELGLLRADGLIIASPMGSSAYSLSAHGPLVHPSMSTLQLTPIAPFLSSMPPLVLPGNLCVHVRVEDVGNWNSAVSEGDICLTVDGQEGYSLYPGDNIIVCGVADGLTMLIEPHLSYLATLRQRGFIREYPKNAGLEPERL